MYFLLVLFYLKAESNVVTMVKLKGAVPCNLAGFRFFCLHLRGNALSWFAPIFVSPPVVAGLGLRNAFNDLSP